MLREELQLLQEQGSYVGEVIKAMDKKKVLVKIHPEGKFVVDIDPKIKIEDIKPTTRVALKSDSYVLHKILPNKVVTRSVPLFSAVSIFATVPIFSEILIYPFVPILNV